MIKIPDIPVSALLKITGGQSAFQNSILSSIPPALLNAQTGSLVNAVVTGAGQGGNFTLKTPNGLLSIQTTLPLQQGNVLEFQVLNPGKDIQLLLTAINAQAVKKPTTTPTDSKKTDSQGAPVQQNITEDELLFTVAAKSKPQSQAQPQQQPLETPAVKAEAPSFQQGQALQASLVSIQEDNFDSLLRLFTFDTAAGKLVPSASSETAPIAPNILAAITKPGVVFSFRVLDVALPLPNPNTSTLPSQTFSTTTFQQPANAPLATTLQAEPSSQTPNVNQSTASVIPQTANLTASTPNITNPASLPASVSAPQVIPANDSPALPTTTPVANSPLPQSSLATSSSVPSPQTVAIPNTGTTPSITTALPQAEQPITQTSTVPNPIVPETVTHRTGGLPLVAATVVGTEKSGDTLVKTPFGSLKLNLDTPLPQNTTLYLELAAIVPPPSVAAGTTPTQTTPPTADGLPQLMKYWSSLNESVKTVTQANPTLGAQIEELFPTPDKHFGTKLMHFITSLQTGSVSEWLGQAFIKTLQQEKKTELLTQLTKEFATLRSAFTESPSTNWQTLIFPVFTEGVLHQARMYIRNMRDNEKQKQGNKDKGADARFVVEVDLEKLGSMQFDGLVRHVDNGKFFDLVIRSHKALDHTMIQDILDIFTTTQEVTGLKGKVSFENTRQFPVNPTQEILAMEHHNTNSIMV